MKQTRVQKSLTEEFFVPIKWINNKINFLPWGEPLGDRYIPELDVDKRFSRETRLDDNFLKLLGMRELQRLNKVCGGTTVSQGWDIENVIKQVAEKLGKGESDVELVKRDSEVCSEVTNQVSTDSNNTEMVVPFESDNCLLETENLVSGAIIAKLDLVLQRLDIMMELLTKPIVSASGVGVDKIDLKIAAISKLTIESIKEMSISDLRQLAVTLELPNSMYHVILRDAVEKEYKKILKIVEISDTYSVSSVKAEKAMIVSSQTGVPIETAIKVC